jgi:hypothetical protein
VVSFVENQSEILGPNSNSSTSTHVHRSRLCVRVFFNLVMNHLQNTLDGSAPAVQRCYLARDGKSNPCVIALANPITWNPRIGVFSQLHCHVHCHINIITYAFTNTDLKHLLCNVWFEHTMFDESTIFGAYCSVQIKIS